MNLTMSRPLASLEAIKLYAMSIGLPESEAERAYDYWESQGWRVGRNPMRSWEAALRNWFRNYRERHVSVAARPAEPSRFTLIKELELVEAEMARIKGRASHTATGFILEDGDRPTWLNLKARRTELKGKLGLL
jgi:hypothetical protein